MASPLVSKSAAQRRRTHHQFVPGLGYFAHVGPPELPPGHRGNKSCDPPAGTPDGSVHMLRPSTGIRPIPMIWHAGDRAWGPTKPGKGNRMAWPPDHLKRAGWEYIGARA